MSCQDPEVNPCTVLLVLVTLILLCAAAFVCEVMR